MGAWQKQVYPTALKLPMALGWLFNVPELPLPYLQKGDNNPNFERLIRFKKKKRHIKAANKAWCVSIQKEVLVSSF